MVKSEMVRGRNGQTISWLRFLTSKYCVDKAFQVSSIFLLQSPRQVSTFGAQLNPDIPACSVPIVSRQANPSPAFIHILLVRSPDLLSQAIQASLFGF